jgi:hypothetical protein
MDKRERVRAMREGKLRSILRRPRSNEPQRRLKKLALTLALAFEVLGLGAMTAASSFFAVGFFYDAILVDRAVATWLNVAFAGLEATAMGLIVHLLVAILRALERIAADPAALPPPDAPASDAGRRSVRGA